MSLLNLIPKSDLADAPLIKIAKVIDWQYIDDELEPLRQLDARRGGPTPWPPEKMFRASLLQDWYRLSFKQLTWAIAVRLDFQVFTGFEPGLPKPSITSLYRARRASEGGGVRARAVEEIEFQLRCAGISIINTRGALYDIKLIYQPTKKEE